MKPKTEYREVVEGSFICVYGLRPGVYRVLFDGPRLSRRATFYGARGAQVLDCNATFAVAHTSKVNKRKPSKAKKGKSK